MVDEQVRKILQDIRETCNIPPNDEKFNREAALALLHHSLGAHQYDDILGKAGDLMEKFFLMQRSGAVSAPALPAIDGASTPTSFSPVASEGVSATDLTIPDSPFPIRPVDDGTAPFLSPNSEGPIPPPPALAPLTPEETKVMAKVVDSVTDRAIDDAID